MKVIVIGGYPGSGKSVIVKKVIAELEGQGQEFSEERQGLMKYMESKKIVILGSYAPGEKFPGTDRLPMNVQPEACAFLSDMQVNNEKYASERVVLFEGDRLFNKKMLDYIKGIGCELIVCTVVVSRENLEQRRNQRSEQNETWRKGRETKVDNLVMSFPVHHHLKNDTEEEQQNSVNELLSEINGTWHGEKPESKIKGLWR